MIAKPHICYFCTLLLSKGWNIFKIKLRVFINTKTSLFMSIEESLTIFPKEDANFYKSNCNANGNFVIIKKKE